jgi:hypothetical protein
VNRRLLLAQQRFADEEARRTLYEMARISPDILQAIIGLLQGRVSPVSLDELYLLNFQIRPVSFSYFRQVIDDNSASDGLFAVGPDGISLRPPVEVQRIIAPRMQGSSPSRDMSALEEAIQAALIPWPPDTLETAVRSIIAAIRACH